jgi:solute carrier family 35 protein F1/2
MMGRMVKATVIGQVLSLLVTGTGFSSSLLVQQGIDAPTSQLVFNYILLAAVNGIYLLRRQKPLKVRWYIYLLLAVIDVEANYLATKAYQYTSITSVMLLDCWTIPCVLLLTWFLLNTHYLRGHFAGVCFCVLGLGLVLLSDVHAGDRSGGSNVLLGDTLILVAATLYGVTNVFEVRHSVTT